MTLVATPETDTGDLCRVRLAITSAPAAAEYSTIERSTDQIRWSTVRGGEAVPLTAGAGHLDDYEFTPNVLNYYRASHVDTASSTGIDIGTAVYGNNASITPPLPAAPVVGDLLMILASIRNSGTGTVNVPAGWTSMLSFGNMALLGRRYAAGVTAPLVTFAGGAANADTMAQMALWRNTELLPESTATLLNSSAQNVARPGLALTASTRCVMQLMWKQDDLTSVATPAGANAVGTLSTTTGDDASMYWSAVFVALDAPDQPSGSFVVTGGGSAISRGAVVALRAADFVTQDTTSTTPVIDKVWIKHIRYPFLNTALSTPTGELKIKRKSRAGVFPVIGRSLPVGVTDLRLGKEFLLGARVEDDTERERLDLVLASGEPILLQSPPTVRLPSSLYAVIGDDDYDDESRTFVLPLTQVAAPAASIVGTTSTYAGVLATYATYADVLVAHATYASILELIGSPGDVITG